MLNGITWGQFTAFVLVTTGAYYLWVFVRFYAADIFGRMKYKALKASEDSAMGKGVSNKGSGEGVAPEAPGNQSGLLIREGSGGGGDEKFEQMQRAIGTIRQVIAQGIENKLDRENLLDHIREVMGDYRQLRKTEYAETINNFLIRVCQSELSLEIGEAELAELWK
jgi:hypothetical protein